MRISFCSIAFRKLDLPLVAIIPRLAKIGYDGIEIWGNDLGGTEDDIEEVAACLAENNMATPMISPYFNITGDSTEWNSTLSAAKTFFDYAVIFKAPLVRVFTGFLGSAEINKEVFDEAAKRLTQLCEIAERKNLSLALETHPKTLVDNIPSINNLLAAVDKPNLVLNLDIYHMWEIHQEPVWIWEQLKSRVRHIHAKNALIPPSNGDDYPLFHDKQGLGEIGGITFLERGNMDYKPFLDALHRDGYNGWISVEWFGSDPFVAAEHEFHWLSELIVTGDEK